jgi:uncharacterized protein (DUF2249 family)
MPFSTNLAGEFQWEYEQEGPVDWIVKIKRIKKKRIKMGKLQNPRPNFILKIWQKFLN